MEGLSTPPDLGPPAGLVPSSHPGYVDLRCERARMLSLLRSPALSLCAPPKVCELSLRSAVLRAFLAKIANALHSMASSRASASCTSMPASGHARVDLAWDGSRFEATAIRPIPHDRTHPRRVSGCGKTGMFHLSRSTVFNNCELMFTSSSLRSYKRRESP